MLGGGWQCIVYMTSVSGVCVHCSLCVLCGGVLHVCRANVVCLPFDGDDASVIFALFAACVMIVHCLFTVCILPVGRLPGVGLSICCWLCVDCSLECALCYWFSVVVKLLRCCMYMLRVLLFGSCFCVYCCECWCIDYC